MRKLSPLLIFFVLFSTSYAQNYGAKSIFKKYNDAVVVIYACDSYGKPFAQGRCAVEGNLDYENLDACKDFKRAYSLGLDDAKEYIDQYCK